MKRSPHSFHPQLLTQLSPAPGNCISNSKLFGIKEIHRQDREFKFTVSSRSDDVSHTKERPISVSATFEASKVIFFTPIDFDSA